MDFQLATSHLLADFVQKLGYGVVRDAKYEFDVWRVERGFRAYKLRIVVAGEKLLIIWKEPYYHELWATRVTHNSYFELANPRLFEIVEEMLKHA